MVDTLDRAPAFTIIGGNPPEWVQLIDGLDAQKGFKTGNDGERHGSGPYVGVFPLAEIGQGEKTQEP